MPFAHAARLTLFWPDIPATGVVNGFGSTVPFVSRRTVGSCQHGPNAFRLENWTARWVVKGCGEAQEIDSRSDPSAIGVHGFHTFHTVRQWNLPSNMWTRDGASGSSPAIIVFDLIGSSIFQEVLSQAHPFNPERIENLLDDERTVTRFGDGFDDATQHTVTEVRVRETGPRVKIERFPESEADEVLRGQGD